jgi:HSP20 family protein
MTHALIRSTATPSRFFGDRDPFGALMGGFFGGMPRLAHDLEDSSLTRGPFTQGWTPAVDIRETDDGFELTAELPGLGKEDIEVSVDNGVLTLRGERTLDESTSKDSFRRVERAYGSFERSFSLPTGIDAGKVEARFDHGLLTLNVPKAETAKARTIKVK